MPWAKITFSIPPNAQSEALTEDLCCELIEHGALGTAVEQAGVISCFADNEPDLLKNLSTLALQHGCKILSTEELLAQNWTQQCEDVWRPLVAGKITIIPVESACNEPPCGELDIKIIPGLGFGTGHHPTTKMILETLSRLSDLSSFSPVSVFDLGTGSGILAIAAAKLWKVSVFANDIDPHAIGNAQDNAHLNRVSDLITFDTTPATQVDGPFDLIIANVYGEVLIQLAPEIARVAAPGAILILSGITELVRDAVVSAYTSPSPTPTWVVEDEVCDDEWVSLRLRRH